MDLENREAPGWQGQSHCIAGKPFEALLRVKVARGVPVDTELVALRLR